MARLDPEVLRRLTLDRRRFLEYLALAGGGALAAACAPAAPPTPTPAPPKPAAPAPAPTVAAKPAAPTPAKQLVKWRKGTLEPMWSQIFRLMPSEKGFYKEEGLDVELIAGSDATQMKALLAGQIELATGIDVLALSAMEQGAELLFVANESRPNDLLYVRPNITRVEDLVGKKVGINDLGGQAHVLIVELFNKYKLDSQKVDFVRVGHDGSRIAALISGQIDATSASIGNLGRIEQAGMKVLLSWAQELPQFVGGLIVVPAKVVREKPELVEADLTAMTRGIRYAIEHPDEAATLGMKLMKEDSREGVLKVVNNFIRYKMVNPNIEVTPEQINVFQDANIREGKQKARLPMEKIANFDLAKRVIARLGKYPGW